MEKVNSRDGTPIAFEVTGQGSPLLLVHGTTADHERWRPLLPYLTEHYKVLAIDRRGRGQSGDQAEYALEREFEDVAAIADSQSEPVNILGHSYGALCTLEAALLSDNIRKIILYEPPIPTGLEIYPAGIIDKLHQQLADGKPEAVIETFFKEVVRMPESELALLKSLPAWQQRVAAAHTIPRELEADERYKFEPAKFRNLSADVLILVGGSSPQFLKYAADAVKKAIPASKLVELPKQQHVAIDTAPDLFIKPILEFLKNPQ